MDYRDFLGVAEAQGRHNLRPNDRSFCRSRLSAAGLHSSDPVGQTAAGAVLHDQEKHRAERAGWSVAVHVVDISHDVLML